MSALPNLPHLHLTVDHVGRMLVQRRALSPAQLERLTREEQQIRAELSREIGASGSRRAARLAVSAPQIIARMQFQSPTGEVLSEDRIIEHLAASVGLPFEKPDPLKLDPDIVTGSFPVAYARRHACVPLRRVDGRLVYAVENPYDQDLVRQLRDLHEGSPVGLVLVPRSDIQRIITEFYGFRSSINAAAQQFGQQFDIGNLEQLVQLQNLDSLEATDRPIITAVEYLLHYAFEQRASDIHIEPKREVTLLRLRIDGVLHNIRSFPKALHAPFVSRIKMLARMDISEKRRAQDGRIKTQRDGSEVELRVSSLPVAFGEKLVVRVFDPHSVIQELASIGFHSEELSQWRSFSARPWGLILVTGPTGSGKTTTLYSTLKELAGPEVNITTVEDPIEMVYEDFNQVLVQRRIDMDFANALRTILRQDPDVVMVGEIRDPETAQMATQAALTGHLVFSTLHTNDTASTITRLLDLGVEPFLLGSTLVGVMAQRLVRTICEECRSKTELTAEQIELLGIERSRHDTSSLPVWYGQGCMRCRGTGYYGRTGVFELMTISSTLRRLINEHASAPELRRAAEADGMSSLSRCAIRKLAQGQTTFEEVLGVLAEY